ncbi:GNAT family N-acetyltransferase [Paenibacillus abyssi]|uniref:Acetyltransferase n=1 Tax=Paenibacillus abyssi TaxID=1340531 RepID=A0A917G7Q1_9BACL|nr:GNAT family N-acetyltransferase [Paenibacillus abyssi]GGG27087.1 acetyltransferase [Paenibacillus abyssi]
MEIRTLNRNEFMESMKLSMYAFQFELSDEQLKEQQLQFKPEETWGAFDEHQQLCAKLTVLPLRTYIQGKPFEMGGIAGVATWPEQRRKGTVKQLIINALKDMKDKGQTLSFLHPFSFAFYHKYGWETYTEYKNYKLNTNQMPPRARAEGSVMRRTERDEALIKLLNEIYEPYARRYNGTLLRTKEWWQTSVARNKKGNVALYYNASNTPTGYAIYEVKQRMLTIHEMVAPDEEARQGLWRFFADHDSMVDQVTLTAVPSDDLLPFMLPDPRIIQEITPYFMARIVDVEGFIQQYPFVALEGEKLVLEVNDAAAGWNEAQFALMVDETGRQKVEKIADAQRLRADATCDIQTLTAMLLGYKRPSTLQALQRLHANEQVVALLERAIPHKATYLMDFF